MSRLSEVVPGQVMEFCLLHNPNISLREIDRENVKMEKIDDSYFITIDDEVINITDVYDGSLYDSIINGAGVPVYYIYKCFETNYILISISDDTSYTMPAYVDIVKQAYELYVEYLKIDSIEIAKEYLLRTTGMVDFQLMGVNDDGEYVEMNYTEENIDILWCQLSSSVMFPIIGIHSTIGSVNYEENNES